jgi:protein-tyrosine kinase
MNFITKALEKDKSLHLQPVKPAPVPRKEPPKVGFSDLDEGRGFAETPGEIHYTYTRKVAVDMESLRQNRLIVAGSDQTLGEAYNLLRTHILHRTKSEGRNTLMLTGPRPNEGKTLTTINLGIAISRKVGQTVLLVDGDLRHPSLHRYLDLPSGPGLIDYLTSGYPIAECLVHPEGLANLVVLPAGTPTGQCTELLSSPFMVDLVRDLKHFYPDRYVLFDLPPLLYADALAFAPLVDGIILVVEAGGTPREEISRAVAMLKEFPVLGLVLNKLDALALSYKNHYDDYGDRDSQKKFRLPWFK